MKKLRFRLSFAGFQIESFWVKFPPSAWIVLFAVAAFISLPKAAAADGATLPTFLFDSQHEGSFGWTPAKGDLSYDFLPDGRLHVQGKDGEATMWEGRWTLKGDQLTMKVPALKMKRTVTVLIDSDGLLLGRERYTRHIP